MSPVPPFSERNPPQAASLLPMFGTLFIPWFRLQCRFTQQTRPESEHHAAPQETALTLEDPVGLLDGNCARGGLLEVTQSAAKAGVEIGMAASQALARCPHLHLISGAPGCEQTCEKQLLQFVETLSPRVEKQASDRWLLDLRGIQPDDWQAWATRALERLGSAMGFYGLLGVAPKPGLSWCAARRATPVRVVLEPERFIEALTFAELEVSHSLQRQLHDWGLFTLGDLLRLPKQATLERLGPEAAGLWEIACDSRESVLRLESFPEPLQLGSEFEFSLESTEPLLFSINRILEQLASRLRLLHRVAAGMELRLTLENAPPYERQFTIPSPSREESVLFRILETHLESLQLESPLTGVFLKIHESLPSSQQLALFENPLRDPNRFGETLARLHALTGEGRVGVPFPANSHRPGVFVLEDPAVVFAPQKTQPAHSAHTPPEPNSTAPPLGIPLRRFRPPVCAQVSLKRHQPASIQSTSVCGTVSECRGPYRLSGEWWEKELWRVEQWDVAVEGKWQGLYRLSRTRQPEDSWAIDGCYDAAGWPIPGKPKPAPAQA